MAEWMKAAVVVILYFVLFYIFGRLVLSFQRKEKSSIAFSLLIGFFVYYSLFQIVTVPLMFTLQPLSRLTGIWGVIVLAIVIVSIFRRHKIKLVAQETNLPGEPDSHKNIFWKFVQVLIVMIHTAVSSVMYFSYWDATFYIGTVSFSVYHNAINTYDPLTGRLLDGFDLKHCLATYHMHDAVVCQLFDLHPLIETKTVMVIVITILVNLAYYCLARKLFEKNEFGVAVMMGFCFLLNLCSYSLYTSSGFLMFRTYEGKAITGALVTAVLFYLFLRLYEDPRSCWEWGLLTLISWGAVAVSASAMMLVPTAIGAYAIVLWIRNREWRVFLRAGISMLPCLISMALYFMYRMGILYIHAWR